MPAYRTPETFTARKRLTLFDVVYEPGDSIPSDVVKEVMRLSALLSSRAIIPDPDPHYRRTMPERGTPTDVPPAARATIPDPPEPEPEV